MRLIKRLVIGFSAAAILLGSSVAMVAAASPTTRYVDDDGQGHPSNCGGHHVGWASIQDAIDDSSPGDQVVICPGVYEGSINISIPRLTVRGFTPWTATVRSAPDLVAGSNLISVVDARGAKVKWLKVDALTQGTCGWVANMIKVVNSPRAEIRANHIGIVGSDGLGSCGFNTGIWVDFSANAHVLWNTITNYKQTGLDVGFSDDLLVRGNTIRWLHTTGSDPNFCVQGINVYFPGSRMRILNNVILAAPGSVQPACEFGIRVSNAGTLVRGNKIRNVDVAISLWHAGLTTVRDNVATVGIGSTGLLLEGTAFSNIFGNVFRAGSFGVVVDLDSTSNNLHENQFQGTVNCVDQGTANIWNNNPGCF